MQEPELLRPRTSLTYEFCKVAFFLSRYGVSDIDGHVHPPEILGATTWRGAYALFYNTLGQQRDPDLITKAFKKMVEEVGMPHLTPHGLRHQYATAAREAGVGMGIISKNMGHASVAITEDIYADVTANVMEEAALKIKNQLFGK